LMITVAVYMETSLLPIISETGALYRNGNLSFSCPVNYHLAPDFIFN